MNRSSYSRQAFPKPRFFIASGCVVGTSMLLCMILFGSWQLYQQIYDENVPMQIEVRPTAVITQNQPSISSVKSPVKIAPTATQRNLTTTKVINVTKTPTPTVDFANELGGGKGKIVFSADDAGNFDIYTSNLDGNDRQQLTDHLSDDWHPIFSPDGQKILFHTKRDGNWEVYIMDANGENKKNLTNNYADDSVASWHPNGKQIIFHSNRDYDYDIYTMNINGDDVTNLTGTRANEFAPVFSVGGNQIAFTRQLQHRQLFVMDSAGENVTQLTTSRSNHFSPNWSPDGEYIIFYTDRDGNNEIYQIDRSGKNSTRLTNNQTDDFYPSYSPDGEWITYHTNIGRTNRDIVLLSRNRLQERSLTTVSSQERMPSWQP